MNEHTFTNIQEELNQWIKLDYIYPDDIPNIELYMDQITTFMDKQLSGNKRNVDDKILTKTMINNYSKNDLLPPSDKKKYSKNHIILLIYIYYMKNFLSISDIQALLKPMTDTYFTDESKITMSDIYENMFALEQQYGIRVRESIQEIYDIANSQFDASDNYLKTFAMITMLSYDIYAKKQLVEKLIDSLQPALDTKEEAKAAKQKEKEAKTKDKTHK